MVWSKIVHKFIFMLESIYLCSFISYIHTHIHAYTKHGYAYAYFDLCYILFMSVARQTGNTVHSYRSCLVLFLHLNLNFVQVWYFIVAIVLVRNDKIKMFNQSINFRGQLLKKKETISPVAGSVSSVILHSLSIIYSFVFRKKLFV